MTRITPTLWLNDTAEQAADFYSDAFEAHRRRTTYFTAAGQEIHGHQPGQTQAIEMLIEDQAFLLLNGGPGFVINPSISFFVRCQTAAEVDMHWEKLINGGKALMELGSYPFSERYGWLSDRYGVNWQLIMSDDVSPKIVPSLMFTGDQAGRAKEAMEFYVKTFTDSLIGDITTYGDDQPPDLPGTVAYGEFTILGQKFAAMDSAQQHGFKFNEAVSLAIGCKDQSEIDEYWRALSADPTAEVCGWLKDHFGVSWQVVPTALNEMLEQGTVDQIERVTDTFMRMKKLDIGELERAYGGRIKK